MKIDRDPTLGAARGSAAAPSPAAAAADRRTGIGAPGADDPSTAPAAAKPAATVELSARSRELHDALIAAKAAADVRADKVEAVRTQLENGTYTVDPAAIATGMLDRRA
jgi:flagellar biosynthesis anti-sigma factor FlgM